MAARRTLSALRPPEASDVSCMFTGHSGATVMLHGSGARAYVRKQTGDTANNERLMRQAEKQRLLLVHGMPFPRVLGHGIGEEGLAYFDMDYAPGQTVADAVIHSATIDRAALKRALGNLLWLFRLREGGPLPAELFRAKIEDITRKCVGHRQTVNYINEIREARTRLLAYDWSGVPESPCHGDLTLENILLTKKRDVVFIDCDDPWVSSWWLDIGKLFQDAVGHWCLRDLYREPRPVQFVSALQTLEQIADDCRELASDSAVVSKLPQLMALNLFRCLPYMQREEDTRFVCARIRSVLTP